MVGKAQISRRGLFGATALLWPPSLARAADTAPPVISPVMRKLSGYMAAAAARPLPDAVMEKAKQLTLDAFAAMISGSQLPAGRLALKFADTYKNGSGTIVASQTLCDPVEAALVNAMLAHGDETDDSHPGSESHPGSSIVAATLAAGERFGIDGMRFLRAMVLGYDIGPRFTEALGGVDYMVSAHRSTHAIAGCFGAAAAAGCAASLDPQQMRWLLSYAAQQASGLASWQRDTQHIEKSFDFAGMPARDGVTAALLVQAGGTGVDDILSGGDNFFAAFHPLKDPAMVVEELGSRYEILRTNVKRWSVGSPIQAPLDALEALMMQNRFARDQVKSLAVRVATSEAAIVDNRPVPDICVQHMLAVMLVDGTVSFRSAHDRARMQNPEVLRQRAKVQLIPDAEFQRLLPARVAEVAVTLTDGRVLRQRISAVKGTFQNPMSRPEITAKARDLIAPVLGSGPCDALIAAIFALDRNKTIAGLRPLLQRP